MNAHRRLDGPNAVINAVPDTAKKVSLVPGRHQVVRCQPQCSFVAEMFWIGYSRRNGLSLNDETSSSLMMSTQQLVVQNL